MMFNPTILYGHVYRPWHRSRLTVSPGSSYDDTLCHLRFDSLNSRMIHATLITNHTSTTDWPELANVQ